MRHHQGVKNGKNTKKSTHFRAEQREEGKIDRGAW